MWCVRWRRRTCRAPTTALPALRTRRPTCSAASIASTAFRAASKRDGIIAAPTALLRTEGGEDDIEYQIHKARRSQARPLSGGGADRGFDCAHRLQEPHPPYAVQG